MKRRRGITLLAVLWYSSLASVLALATLGMVQSVRYHLAVHKLEQQAEATAASGLGYGRVMVTSGRWHAPKHFSSPPLPDGGRFEVDLSTRNGQPWLRAVGHEGRLSRTAEGAAR